MSMWRSLYIGFFYIDFSLTVKKILITRLDALIRKERQTAGQTNPREGEIVWLLFYPFQRREENL